ncbi:MAG: M48 family metalloprotease [Treponema sp.]|nr:M48 family metalloprotease [Treponema sp.]
MKKTVIIAIILCISLQGCKSITAIADIGAQVAGAAGVIDQNTVDAISSSARAISSAAEEITPEQEYYIGRAVAATILSNYRLWDGDPALTAYLNHICKAIVINSDNPEIFGGYRVAILDSDEINAFATSSGHIFITRGLIAGAGSEDALAAVIAHEVAHVQLQHSIKAIRTSRITQALMVTGTSAAGVATGYNVNELTSIFEETVNDIVSTLINNGYSQTQEFEADSAALALLAGAGYNPSGLINVLQELERTQSRRPGGFNRTHPTPASRLSNARSELGRHNVADTSASRRARFEAAVR